jgi:hypothetical protein
MSNAAELALVRKAIESGLGGCVEWEVRVMDRVAADLARHGLTLLDVRAKLISHVRAGGDLSQVKEERTLWSAYREYWYKAIIPVECLKNGLFVEIMLNDDDPDLPEVLLVNAHEQQ